MGTPRAGILETVKSELPPATPLPSPTHRLTPGVTARQGQAQDQVLGHLNPLPWSPPTKITLEGENGLNWVLLGVKETEGLPPLSPSCPIYGGGSPKDQECWSFSRCHFRKFPISLPTCRGRIREGTGTGQSRRVGSKHRAPSSVPSLLVFWQTHHPQSKTPGSDMAYKILQDLALLSL